MKKLCVFAANLLVLASTASAFPSWMGVYGDFVRHDEGNPGTFQIMMNQSYFGLHAGVGIRVDDGEWSFQQMQFIGDVDGNSVWQYSPSEAFAAGSTVSYYFHGWDDWGGVIWDSNDGANYEVTISGGADTLSFETPITFDTYHGSYRAEEVVVNDQWVFLAGSVGNVAFCQRFRANDLLPSLGSTLYQGAEAETVKDIAVAASENVVFVAYPVGDTVHIRSTTWNQGYFNDGPVHPHFTPEAGSTIQKVDICVPSLGEVIVVCSTASESFGADKIWIYRSTSSGDSWAPAVLVDEAPQYGNFYSSLKVAANDNGIYIAYPYRPVGYNGNVRVASSTDGINWTKKDLGGDRGLANIDLMCTQHKAMVALDPYYDNYTRIWTSSGGEWASQNVGHEYDNSRVVKMAERKDGSIAIVRQTLEGASFRISADGSTWSDAGNVASAPTGGHLSTLVSDGNDVRLLWGSISVPQLQKGSAAAAEPVYWVGSTYHWPWYGEIDSSDDIWINCQTWPAGAATSAYVVYTENGADWLAMPMSIGGPEGNNDWWHVNMGSFSSGTHIEYVIVVYDGLGNHIWDNNAGQDFHAYVN
ncbi:MAG: hypothetical protein KJ626_04170 [Verrucomicrobia bacterium]|nr:hypothetical protein [Verrucomicrobiota bacterium]